MVRNGTVAKVVLRLNCILDEWCVFLVMGCVWEGVDEVDLAENGGCYLRWKLTAKGLHRGRAQSEVLYCDLSLT